MSCDASSSDQIIRIKRGSTFRYRATVRVSGVAQDITGWVIDSQVREVGGTSALCGTLVVSDRVDSAGEYVLECDTDAWPEKRLQWDIRYTVNGRKRHTETRIIVCSSAVTQG